MEKVGIDRVDCLRWEGSCWSGNWFRWSLGWDIGYGVLVDFRWLDGYYRYLECIFWFWNSMVVLVIIINRVGIIKRRFGNLRYSF